MTTYINVGNVTVGEGSPYVDFIVTLSSASTTPVTVHYSTYDGTATGSYYSANDFLIASGTLTFTPGTTAQTVRVTVGNDNSVDPLKVFFMSLDSPTNAVIARKDATALIVDNDRVADTTNPAHLSVRDVVVDATAGTATFAVILDKATTAGFNVDYSSVAGSAAANFDYTPVAGTLSFGAGEVTKSVTVNLLTNPGAHGPTTFNLNLGAITGAAAGFVTLGDASGQALIGAHGQTPLASPTLSVSSPTVSEADGYVDFVVSLNAPGVSDVSLNYSTSDGTASGSYYSTTAAFLIHSGTLHFAPGVTTQTVRIALGDNNIIEPLRTFSLDLSGATNAVIGNSVGTATIVDNDTIADTVNRANLSVRDVVVDVKTGIVTFAVVLDKATTDTFSVDYASVAGSAAANQDYIPVAGNLTFGPGETVKTVTVNVLDDGAVSLPETFSLQLGAVTGKAAATVQVADGRGEAQIGGHGQTVLATPAINVLTNGASEHDGYVDFVVSLSAPSSAPVTVNYSTADGTAYGSYYSNTSDFIISSGKLTFAPGTTTQTVRIPLGQDSTVDAPGTFYLQLSGAVNALIARPFTPTVIYDDNKVADTVTPANLFVKDVIVDASTGIASFVVALDKITTNTFKVAYSTTNGTALAGTDYTATSGVLTFGPGETAKTVTVGVLDPAIASAAKSFSLNLGGVSGNAADTVLVFDGVGIATIGSHGQNAVSSPIVSVTSPTAVRSEGYADFVVSLNAPSSSPVSVQYATADGSATGSYYSSTSDFIITSGKLNFVPGVTTQSVRIALGQNASPTETFSLKLSSPVNVVISNPVGTATLLSTAIGTGTVTSTVSLSGQNDTFAAAANQNYDGRAGVDMAIYNASSTGFTITRTNLGFTVTDNVGNKGTNQFYNVERLHFSDKDIALDVEGTGGQAYRLYQAAFNRAPDKGGLGFQMHALDSGYSLTAIAQNFIDSPEFSRTYGSLSDSSFVNQLYSNILHRAGEAGGVQFYVQYLGAHPDGRANVLAGFSDSPENQVNVIGSIQNGFEFIPIV